MVLSHHADYLNRHGFVRWVLRESVRANPLYVISALLVANGVVHLNAEMDPQVGKMQTVFLVLLLLHIYELALLAVATTILKRRQPPGSGGMDLHGLMITGALFLGGSFVALDELVTLFPEYGPLFVVGALILAYAKLAVYGGLPGIQLPAAHRRVAIGVLGGHALSSLIVAREGPLSAHVDVAAGWAWWIGWLSLLPAFWLLARDGRRETPSRQYLYQGKDVLDTPYCGVWLVGVSIATGVCHLFASEWMLDRGFDRARWIPVLTLLTALLVLRRFQLGKELNWRTGFLIMAPALVVQAVWALRMPKVWDAWMLAGPAVHATVASAFFYAGLAWATRQRILLIGLIGPVAAPVWARLWWMKGTIPYFRALVSATLGFLALGGGMLISLYRERILRWLDPLPPPAAPLEKEPALP